MGGACDARDVEYVLGSEMTDVSVVPSVWRGLAQAHGVVLDLSRCNPNVAFELGIADAVGRGTFIVSEGDPGGRPFASVAKRRVTPYSTAADLEAKVVSFLDSEVAA